MFKVKVKDNKVAILKLDILHKEEQLPVVVFTVSSDVYQKAVGNSIEVYYADTPVARGTAKHFGDCVVPHKSTYQLALEYAKPTLTEREVCDYYDPAILNQDHNHQSAVAQFKLLNYSLLDGTFVRSAILPTEYHDVLCECYEKHAAQKAALIKAVRIEIDAKWMYENCGYFDLGVLVADAINESVNRYREENNNFRTVDCDYTPYGSTEYDLRRSCPSHMPFELASCASKVAAALDSHTWIARNKLSFLDLFCYKHHADSALVSGMHTCIDLLLGWQVRTPVEERVLVDLRNPLYKDIDPNEVQLLRFHVAPSTGDYPLWKGDVKYSVGDTVSLGGKVYRCIAEHQESLFTDPAWRSDSKWEAVADARDREDCYFTTARGRCTLSYACNIAAGYLLRHTRTHTVTYTLPAKYITKLSVGSGVCIVTTGKNASAFAGVVAECHLVSDAKKSYLKVKVVSADCILDTDAADASANGLRINTPDADRENRFFLSPASVKHRISQAEEELEIQLPQHHLPDCITHDVSAEWMIKPTKDGGGE